MSRSEKPSTIFNPPEYPMSNHSAWNVLSHGPIETLSPRLRRVEGEVPGMPLKRVMTVIKRETGGLIVHSAICLDDDAMAELEAWGTPEILVVPGRDHRLDARPYLERYPDLVVVCPRGVRKHVEAVVPVALTYDHWCDDPRLADATVIAEHLDGTAEREGVLHVVEAEGRTLITNDIVFNMPHQPGFYGFILKHLLRSSGGPRVSRLAKLRLVPDPKALRRHLLRLAELPNLTRLIVSHHEPMNDPATALR
jgi:hypothetical protein